jgi:hypothetical protein
MYSGEYDACDVTLSVYPHRASRQAGNTLFKINKKEHASPINSGLISMRGVLNIKNV